MLFLPRRRQLRLRRTSHAAAVVSAAVRSQLETLESRRLLADVSWINPLGGDFNDPANWDTNSVPSASDDAFITLEGDYVVTIAPGGNALVNALTLGSPTGVQTLSVDGATLTAASSFTNDDIVQLTSTATLAMSGGTFAHTAGASIGGGGTLSLNNVTATLDGAVADLNVVATGSTLSGAGTIANDAGRTLTLFASTVNTTLANNGTLEVIDDSSITGGLTTGVGSMLRVRGNSSGGAVTLTVASGFTNNGTLELTSSDSSNAATLALTTGTLTNSASGTISVLAGTGGARTLTTQLANQGAVTIGAATTLARADADHTSSGSISLTGGNLTVTQTGTTPSFTNSGTITVGSSFVLTVSNGAFSLAAGSIGGSGTLALSGVVADFATSFSNATTTFVPLLSSIAGPGTITNAAGRTLTLFGTTFTAPLVNNGLLEALEDSVINGTFTSGADSTIRIRGNASGGSSSISFASGFTNNGTIELTASDSAQDAAIVVTSGTLTNASGRTLSVLAGTGGARVIAAAVNNQGTIAVGANTTVFQTSGVHSNSGAINLTGGSYTVFQSGAGASFTNTGSISISSTRALTISGGQFNQSAGSISGAGSLALLGVTANFATSFSNATTSLGVAGSTINGAGTITNAAGKLITLTNTIFNTPFSNESLLLSRGTADAINGTFTSVAGSIIRVQGNSGAAAGAQLTFANGFTNNGTIDLTAADGAFNATLNVTAGRLTNASGRTISASPGTGGNRAFNAQFTNNGTISVNAPLTMTKADAAQVNSGSLNVATADLTVTLSGTSPSFSNFGTINVPAGRTLTVTGASLASIGAIRSGGTIVANVVNGGGLVSPERPGTGNSVYYESFNYNAGSQLNGQGGWVEPGLNDSFSNDFQTPELIQASSLSYPNLATNGRSVQAQGLYSFDSNTFPSFLGGNGSTYWVGFLIRRDQNGVGGAAGADFGGISLSTGPGIFIGKPGGGAGVNNWSLERGDAAAQSSSSVASTLGTTAFLVARIQFNDDGIAGTTAADNEVVTLYVNPTPGTAEASLVPAASLSLDLFDFNGIAISTGASAKWSFDEIRAGTTFADVAPRATTLSTVNGNFSQTAGTFAVDIAGPTVDSQYDQLVVNGTVSLTGSLSVNSLLTPAGMQTFTIINNDGTDAVSGTFSGLAEGSTFVSNNRTYRISYIGGTGNDVTLTSLPSITISDLTISEGTGGTKQANFTVTLSDAGSATSTVQWATSNGTATEPADYTAASGTVTFNPFVTSQQISITLNSDALDEADENFNITLSNPTNAIISDGSAIGTITDDDPTPTLSIDDVIVTEGDVGTQNAVFTVTLSAASGRTVTVNAITANGTAVAPADYTALASQLLTFLPGELTKTVTVVVGSDLLDEANETYVVNLSGATNATISDNQGLGTITDNDPLPNLSINDVAVSEGDAGTKLATFTISLSTASGRNVTLNYATADSTATSASGDYVALPSTPLTFLPGETSKQVSVTINGDLPFEPSETFLLNLSGVTNANVTDGQGQGTITNDDTAVTVTITPIAPDPRTNAVSSVTITFAEAVNGFALEDLGLTRDGATISLAGATLTTTDNITWTLGNLSGLTDRAGTYVVTLSDIGTVINGAHGWITNSPQSDTWRMTAVLGTSGNDDIRLVKNASTGRADVFVSGVFAYDFDFASLGFVNLLGGDGDDLLTVDTTNGVPLPINVSVMGSADGEAGNDTIRFIGASAAASHTFTSTLIQGGLTLGHFSETLELQSATYTATADLANTSLVLTGAGTNAVFSQTQHLGGLSVGSGAHLAVTSGGSKVLVTKSLSAAGLIDLADNDMIIDFDPLAPNPFGSWSGAQYTGVQGLITAARGDGTWNGAAGLGSTAAVANYTGLAANDAATEFTLSPGATALFSGQTVDASAVIVKFTYVGDANLDGIISGDDYSAIDFNIATPNSHGFTNGDFNWDGIISGDDYTAIDFNIVAQGSPL